MHPTALDLALQLRDGPTTSEALTERALEASEAQSALAPWVRTWPNAALRSARSFDARIAAGEVLPPLAGLPGGVKDIDPVAMSRTQFGSRALRWLFTPTDGPVAKRVRAMQPILGKLQTSELAILPVTETDLHPPARNPFAPDRTPGGSSGGSSVAVAAGILPIAQGSDGGGSIRIPAALCGLFGHKASRGLHPSFYGALDVAGLSSVGCLAHTVDDAAAWMDGFLGRRYAPDAPPPDSLLGQARVPPPPLRIRLVLDTPLADVPDSHVAATRRAAALLRAAGHTVTEGHPIEEVSVDDFVPLYGYMMGAMPLPVPQRLQPATRYIRGCGEGWTRARTVAHAAALVARIDAWWGDEVDAVLSPTTAAVAPRIGAWEGLDGHDTFAAAVPLGAFTAPYNIGGQAAASVPLGVDDDGMPIGVQLACRRGQDALLLALCRQLESGY